MDARALIVLAAKVRVALLAWGFVQDSFFEVPYTDVDYDVFTDAARFMAGGHSPYERDTYRYSPLLAGALIPNVLVHPLWGKCLFASGDLLAGWLIKRILERRGCEEKACATAMAVWLFNPFTVTVSTRGSCESLVSIMMLTVLHGLLSDQVAFAAAVYGVATHLRIYPVIYALPTMAFLGGGFPESRRPPSRRSRSRLRRLVPYGGHTLAHLDLRHVLLPAKYRQVLSVPELVPLDRPAKRLHLQLQLADRLGCALQPCRAVRRLLGEQHHILVFAVHLLRHIRLGRRGLRVLLAAARAARRGADRGRGRADVPRGCAI